MQFRQNKSYEFQLGDLIKRDANEYKLIIKDAEKYSLLDIESNKICTLRYDSIKRMLTEVHQDYKIVCKAKDLILTTKGDI